MPGSSSAMIENPTVERGRILAVNVRDYTVDVVSEFSQKVVPDLPFAVPYTHHTNGEGINYMPEVGATCWFCLTSDRQGLVLGFTPVVESGGYRGGRPLLSPGDIHLSTRNGNFVSLKRGGIVQVGSSTICQRVYLPIKNIIKDFCENYELHTFGGDLTWTVDRQEEDEDGHKGTTFYVAVKEYADDPNEDPLASLKIGSHGESEDTILTLETRDKGAGNVQIQMTFDKTGNVEWSISNNLTMNVTGAVTLESQDTITLNSKNAFSIQSATAKMTLKAVGMDIQSSLGLSISSKTVTSVKGTLVKLNAGPVAFPVVRSSPDLIAWIAQVTAYVNAGIPVAPPVPVVPPTQHMNFKVLT